MDITRRPGHCRNVTGAYRTWCRSTGVLGCNPYAIGAGMLVLALAIWGIDNFISTHMHGILLVLRDTLAAALCALAAVLAAVAARIAMREQGTAHEHGSATAQTATAQPATAQAALYVLRSPAADEAAARAAGTVLPADVLQHLAGLPVNSDTGWPEAMAAEADRLAAGDRIPLVTPEGTLIEVDR